MRLVLNSQDCKLFLIPNSKVYTYLLQDEDAAILVNTVDISFINLKEEMKVKAIRYVIEDDDETEN